MNRREWLKLSTAGVATVGAGFWPSGALAQAVCDVCDVGPAGTPYKTFELEVGDTQTRMVDGEMVNQLAYRLAGAQGGAWRIPGPTLRVKEGSLVEVKVTNTRREFHGFEVTGVPGTKTEVAPGCSCTVRFVAPVAGTYVFHDSTGETPLYRILGLHGVLVVEPLFGVTRKTRNNPYPSVTPYSLDKLEARQVNSITKLFDALGTTERFLGGAEGKWVPASESEEYANQEKVWVLSEIDPKFNALVLPGQQIASSALALDVVGNFKPRYFTLLNRSGFDLHVGQDVCPDNYIGEPTLIRMVNVGLAHHAMHTHGNHWLRLSQANLVTGEVEVADNIFEVDTVAMWPMDRRDLLLPFEIPPDIPYKAVDAAEPGTTQFEEMVAGRAQEPFPLRYVVHDHVEMATTAGGGNYPQGMVTHWEIMGGLGGRAAVQASLGG